MKKLLGLLIVIHATFLAHAQPGYALDRGEPAARTAQPFIPNQAWVIQQVREQFPLPAPVFLAQEGREAVSSNSAFAVRIAAALPRRGAVTITTPEGQTLSGQPVALSLYDFSAGKNALIAEIKAAQTRVVSGNQVVFEHCWDSGVTADLLFEVGRLSFSQSVIWRTQPPDPKVLGLDPRTTRLQIWTEFSAAPEPGKRAVPLKEILPGAVWQDEDLNFGKSRMSPGRAYAMELGANGGAPGDAKMSGATNETAHAPVAKKWYKVADPVKGDRTYLIEEVEYEAVAPIFKTLPKAKPDGAFLKERIFPGRLELPKHLAQAYPATPFPPTVLMAATARRPGLLVDYELTYQGYDDLDGDRMPDLWEILWFGSTNAVNDSDSLSVTNEFYRGTDPTLADSDFDGVADDADAAPLIPNYLTERVWVEDVLPTNLVLVSDEYGYATNNWYYLDATNTVGPVAGTNTSFSKLYAWGHQHYFYNHPQPLSVATGEVLFAYVYLPVAREPQEVMLQWRTSDYDWNHRAYWGSDHLTNWGPRVCLSTNVPLAGKWVRLEVPASMVGLEGKTVIGMAFSLYGGEALWDHAGVADRATDSDGDGVADYQETLNGTNPYDYYDGTLPQLSVLSGNGQTGYPSNWLGQALTVEVRNAGGNLLANAPLTFELSAGGAGIALTNGGTLTTSLGLRANASGQAAVWMKLPVNYATTNQVTVAAASGTNRTQVVFSEYSYAQVGLPVFSPDGGNYAMGQTVALTCPTTGAAIYYTLDGSEPSEISNYYFPGSTLAVAHNLTLKARAFKSGYAASEVKTGVYTITGSLGGGFSFSLASRSDGAIWAWGANSSGQLGIGSRGGSTNVPVIPIGLSNAVSVKGGLDYALVLKSDGTVWASGGNSSGQLGIGSMNSTSNMVQVTNLAGVAAIAAGPAIGTTSFAVKSNGTVWAWGYNGSGQLGDGTTTTQVTPVEVTNLAGLICVAPGSSHTLGIKTNGTVWAWGNNNNGQLGDTTTTARHTPVQTTNMTNVLMVAAGANFSLAVKNDGTIWGWGVNTYGQLGINTNTPRYYPVQTTNISNAVAVAAGASHAVALRADGLVWTWGSGSSGQLGHGQNTNAWIPVCVSNLSNVVAIAAGGSYSLAMRADGTIWAWGAGTSGQLGHGTNANSNVPVQVTGLRLVNWDDHDLDGLPTWRELELGTDPNVADSDYDGVSDGQEVLDGTSPTSAASVTPRRLAYWKFDQPDWRGETNGYGAPGPLPIYTNGLQRITSWSSNAVNIPLGYYYCLQFRETETNVVNGTNVACPNINLQNGTVRFWMKPNWTSANLGGTGPQNWSRIMEFGRWSEARICQWTIRMNPAGNELALYGASDGAEGGVNVYFEGMVSNTWYQVTVTYSPTNSAIYLNGELLGTGGGMTHYASAGWRSSWGFIVGTDGAGVCGINAALEEMETFNYPLSDSTIANGYQDTDGDGLADVMEDSNGNGIYDVLDFGDLRNSDYSLEGYWSQEATNAILGFKVYTPLK